MSTAVKIESRGRPQHPVPEASSNLDKKYRLTAKDGTPIDHCRDDTYKRVARALADVEKEEVREHWYSSSLALRRGAIRRPVTSNAGAQRAQSRRVHDQLHVSAPSAFDGRHLRKVHEAVSRSGRLRHRLRVLDAAPRGAYVSGAGAYTSGPLSFMDIYDKMCFTVSSAGGRRARQMGTFDVGHPRRHEFIRAKREAGGGGSSTCPLLVTDEFHESRAWRPASGSSRSR